MLQYELPICQPPSLQTAEVKNRAVVCQEWKSPSHEINMCLVSSYSFVLRTIFTQQACDRVDIKVSYNRMRNLRDFGKRLSRF